MIHRLAPHLLRRHVADGAQHGAGTGVLRGRQQVRARAAGRACSLGEAEVEQLRAPLVRHEDVLRLQVPVNDPLLVRRGQSLCDLRGEVDRLAGAKRALPEAYAQRLAFEELHDGVRGLAVPPEIVDGEDVRVREGRNRAGLALEAGQRLGVARELGGEHLDGDVPAQLGVAGFVDLAHPPRAERCEDLVRVKTGAGLQAHRAPSTT